MGFTSLWSLLLMLISWVKRQIAMKKNLDVLLTHINTIEVCRIVDDMFEKNFVFSWNTFPYSCTISGTLCILLFIQKTQARLILSLNAFI